MARKQVTIDVQGTPVTVSNLDKVLFPDDGITKGDLINYYLRIAPHLLPYVKDRPLSLRRYPDGINGPHFWEKDAPDHKPDFVPTWPYQVEQKGRGVIHLMMANNLPSLVWMANLASIDVNPWLSRIDKPNYPDYLVFDLDPFEPATFDDTLEIGLLIKQVLDTLGLVGYPKTSGKTGLQIFVPIVRRYPYEEARAFVEAIAAMIYHAYPEKITWEWAIKLRTGKIRIDYTQNVLGKTIASVYCVRARPGAPVSTPLHWEEVASGGFVPRDFHIGNIFDRLEREGDLFRPVLDSPQDLGPALVELGLRPGRTPRPKQEIQEKLRPAGKAPQPRSAEHAEPPAEHARPRATEPVVAVRRRRLPPFGGSPVRFGPSGLRDRHNLRRALDLITQEGYNATEVEFVREFYLNERQCSRLGDLASEYDVYLSVHAPYFATLSVAGEGQPRALNVLQHTAHLAALMGARLFVTHVGSFEGRDPEQAWADVRSNLENLSRRCFQRGYDVLIGAENAGKKSQMGQLRDLLPILREVERVVPVVDVAHLHATTDGGLRSRSDFRLLLDTVRDELGDDALHPLHVHFTDVAYGPHGEIEHIPYGEGTLRIEPLVEALLEVRGEAVIISEAREPDSTRRMLQGIRHVLAAVPA